MPSPTTQSAIGAALAIVAVLATSACADRIPSQLPHAATLSAEHDSECGWQRWLDAPLNLKDWFEEHPEIAALHHWDSPSGAFLSARRDSIEEAPSKMLLRSMVVWVEPQAQDPPNVINVDDAGGVIQLEQGINLVRWWGREGSSVTIRDAFRWIGPSIESIVRFDDQTASCHRDVGVSPTERNDLDAELSRGDLLAIQMREDATWTQSWIWSPNYSTFGDVDPQASVVLREQVREFSGYVAARFGLAAESYAVMLLSDVEGLSHLFKTLTGNEFDTDWWPEYACGIAWSDAIGLLEGCRDPIAFDHEFVHVIQAQLARGRIGSSWETEPAWLIEGAAEYISARYRDAMSYKSYRDFREDAIDIARERVVALPLERLVSREGFRELDIVYAYSFSFLAAEWLAAHAGDDALFRYMRQLSRAGTNWDLAFEIAFGLRVEEFYKRFEEHSSDFEEPRPHRIAGTVLDDSGRPVPNLKIHAYPQTGGWSRNAETDATGDFSIAVRVGTYRLGVHSETSCTFYGYVEEGGNLVPWFAAAWIDAGSGNSEQRRIRLPGAASDLRGWSTCREAEGREPIRGRVLTPDGRGAPDVHVSACGDNGCGRSITDETGAYSIDVAESPVLLSVGPNGLICERWGARGANGNLTTFSRDGNTAKAQRLTNGVDILLPAPPEELEVTNFCWQAHPP
ncbi:MAG: hypothetical protein F4X58_11075 [Chloroflexi bacterium]|nr:hypothetical protein [Chloroflexota bacterium]MYC02451.1 hypothetical protein [Chloroflexota bacterium]